MNQDLNIYLLIFFILIMVALTIFIAVLHKINGKVNRLINQNPNQNALRLQAYERLTLYADRMHLHNLITRVEPVNNSVASMQIALITEIKEEYQYNVSQQIYVSAEVWHAVTRLKDQNIYLINQIAGSLPIDAEAKDLKFKILEFTKQEKTDLGLIVLDAIQFEAKKYL